MPRRPDVSRPGPRSCRLPRPKDNGRAGLGGRRDHIGGGRYSADGAHPHHRRPGHTGAARQRSRSGAKSPKPPGGAQNMLAPGRFGSTARLRPGLRPFPRPRAAAGRDQILECGTGARTPRPLRVGLGAVTSALGAGTLVARTQGIQELAQRNSKGVGQGMPGAQRSDGAALFDLDEGAARQAAAGSERVVAPAPLSTVAGKGLPECRRIGVRRRKDRHPTIGRCRPLP